MGMRCTQIIGLNAEAFSFIEKNANRIGCDPCPHCKEYTKTKIEAKVWKDALHEGMFDDGPFLYEYALKDGRKVREIVQATLWSSGPCIFLCLEDQDGNRMFEWSQEELDNC